MKENIKLICIFPLLIFHVVAYVLSNNRKVIDKDIEQWKKVRAYVDTKHHVMSLLKLLAFQKDFRTQFYYRIGVIRNFLQILLTPIHDISFEGCKIGPGFVLIHGFGCVLNGGAVIGKNCTMLHGVTIGTIHGDDFPIIGDDVYIGAGAIILGNVHIGNHVKIGAGAIVVDNMPDNSTVVGMKAKIIKK